MAKPWPSVTPVYTTYGGRLGGVDEWLIRENPGLIPLVDPHALRLRERDAAEHQRMRRDPAVLLDLMLSAASHTVSAVTGPVIARLPSVNARGSHEHAH